MPTLLDQETSLLRPNQSSQPRGQLPPCPSGGQPARLGVQLTAVPALPGPVLGVHLAMLTLC